MTEQEIKTLLEEVLGKGASIDSQLLGGMMNISYVVKDAKGKKYVLYIPTEQANEMVNRELEKENQRIVHALGITSKNFYFDTKTGIKINEYIEGQSIDKETDFDITKIAKMLKKLHQSVMLAREDYNPFDRFVNIYEREALTFLDGVDPLYNQLRSFLFSNQYYLESQPKVLCHNDAQRSNIIKTPDDKYFIIDFEFMANNDPIYDIAAFGNGVVAEGRKLLEEYYDGKPNEDKIKRYYLWRIYISLQWYVVAIVKHFRGEGEKHNFNFLDVANHFLMNAKDAFEGYHLEIQDKKMSDDTEKLIIETLDKVRHFLQRDGGDCEYVSFEDGIVFVRMHGACQDCAYADNDIKDLVEVILQEEVPGVLEVRLVP